MITKTKAPASATLNQGDTGTHEMGNTETHKTGCSILTTNVGICKYQIFENQKQMLRDARLKPWEYELEVLALADRLGI